MPVNPVSSTTPDRVAVGDGALDVVVGRDMYASSFSAYSTVEFVASAPVH